MLSQGDLVRTAADTGFRVEPLEKVERLLDLLDGLRSHPFLKQRIVLKGGTALNLFLFDVPRLSVDIDLNYVGPVDRGTMMAERPKVEQAIAAVCGRLGIQVKRSPPDHAGGKWRLWYTTVAGRPGSLELDVNFVLRTPLWAPAAVASRPVGPLSVDAVPLLEQHELAAGKLAALFGRTASRDLFDARELLASRRLREDALRLGFVAYGAMNRRDWRELSIDDVKADPAEVDRDLVPMLRAEVAPGRSRVDAWTRTLIGECRDLVSTVLPLRPEEVEFLDALNDRGEIVPELLTADARVQGVLQAHPALQWKALNVRRHRGLPGALL